MNISTNLDKSFWAMYLGMAANNLLAVVQYIERKFANDLPRQDNIELEPDETEDAGFSDAGIKRIENSPALKYLQEGTDIRLQKKIMDELTKRLAFLREIKKYKETGFTPKKDAEKKDAKDKKQDDKQEAKQLSPTQIVDIFLDYAKLLYGLRNKYTHVIHSGAKHTMPFKLYNLLAWNAQTTKERFYKMPNNDAASEKIMNPLRRNKGVDKATKKPKENPDFLCPLFLKNDPKETDNDFTPIGRAFFAAQFLESKYISQMIQGLHLPEKQLIIRAFAITHINLPRTRLETDEEINPTTLGMDMLAELHKCPDELFKMLSTEDQGAFRHLSEDGVTENLFKRFGRDRFAYLALNYLDLQKKFDFLRFAIDKGNFFFADYGKTGMIDGVPIEHRRLSKRVYCFKRMQDAQAEYKTDRDKTDTLYWKAKEGASPKGIYRIDMLPQYAVDANNIGLKLLEQNEPDLNKQDDKGRIKFNNQQPDCWLSLYELPVIVFLATQGKAAAVEKRIKEYYEGWNRLRGDIANGKTISEKDVAETYGIQFTDLPSDVKAHIKTGKPRQNTKFMAVMQAALEKMIADTQRKRDNFRKEQDVVYKQGGFKQGKKSKQPKFKAGGMAAFIAKDAVRLQKPDESDTSKHKGKITSANFQALQTSLALFDCRKDSLKSIFEKAGLTRNPKFIENLFNGTLTSLESLYKKYLEGKIKFLEGFRNKPEDCYVLRRSVYRNNRKKEIGYITKQAAVWEKSPVNLPRGMFVDIVLDVLKEQHPTKTLLRRNNAWVNAKDRPHNTTFLIQKFHEWNGESGDGSQWFYSQARSAESETLKRLTSFLKPGPNPDSDSPPPRKKNTDSVSIDALVIDWEEKTRIFEIWQKDPNYLTLHEVEKELEYICIDPFVERLKKIVDPIKRQQMICANKKSNFRLPKGKVAEFMEKLHRIVKSFDDLEKTLRHIRLQDIALFYAAVEMLEMKNVQGIQLQNIKRETNLLDEKKTLQWSFKLPNRPLSPDEKKAKPVVSLPNDLAVTLTGSFKVKDFGNFRRVINDVRLPSLLRNLLFVLGMSPNEIDYACIVAEFDDYDNLRQKVFEAIHALESEVVNKYNLQPTKKDGAVFIDFPAVVNRLEIAPEKKSLLYVYRNAFAHQEYPEFVFLSNEEDSPVTERGKALFAQERENIAKRPEQTLTKRIVGRLCEVFDEVMESAQSLQEPEVEA